MHLSEQQIHDLNQPLLAEHQSDFSFLAEKLDKHGVNVDAVIAKLEALQVATPSWALGAGGTRFGRFSKSGEPANLVQKIHDVGTIHALTHATGAISLHIPWDIPQDVAAIRELAASYDLAFDAVNSNTFQDQPDQALSYQFGSLCHTDSAVRKQAIAHNVEVIELGEALGSKSLTVWLADGSSFPGQANMRKALERTRDSLQQIYAQLPTDWKMYIEYKPYEPNFYHTVIPDWGTSLMLAQACGEQAYTLVDLGHHLPNTNIEQVVATLMMQGKLGGFHFNDSKYGDDDLTCGSIKPYQLFLIFNELVYGMTHNDAQNPDLTWMIDASHNYKDPLEDLIQSLQAIRLAYAQALTVNRVALEAAQADNDVTLAQEVLQGAYRRDLAPLLAEARLRNGACLDPIQAYRALDVRGQLTRERGEKTVATGL
jgi:L-rhamnose isomerase/sugar isomerase